MPKNNHGPRNTNPADVTELRQQRSMQGNLAKTEAYVYQSSLPHPSIVEGYQRIDATFPERIMKQFEKNAEHFRQQDSQALHYDAEEKKRGQWMAFIIVLLGVSATIVTAVQGLKSAAIASALSTAVLIFKGVFIKR